MITLDTWGVVVRVSVCVVLVASLCVLCYQYGFERGRARGTSEGWLECFLARGRDERRRHGKDGRYVSTKGDAP